MTTEQIVFAIVAGVLGVWLILMEWRLRKVFRGNTGMDLESAMRLIAEELDTLHSAREKHEISLLDVEKKLGKTIRGVGTVRFNPFKEMGGNQSFATAFLNEHGDGVVISAIYGRDHTGVYAKPVKNLVSDFELTPEEEQAIMAARIADNSVKE